MIVSDTYEELEKLQTQLAKQGKYYILHQEPESLDWYPIPCSREDYESDQAALDAWNKKQTRSKFTLIQGGKK